MNLKTVPAILLVCTLLVGCDRTKPKNRAAQAKPPDQVTMSTTPAVAPQQKELKDAELCSECDRDCDQYQVEDVYVFPDNKKLVAFSESVRGPNASYDVVLITKDSCLQVLEDSGTSINFIPKPDKTAFPDVGVMSHWSSQESVSNDYYWNGHRYVSKDH